MHSAKRLVVVTVLAGAVIPATGRHAWSQLFPGELSVAVGDSTGVDELRQWDATIDGMTRSGELVVVSRQDDRSLPGRSHEYLAQFFEGVRVHGGGVSRQLDRGATVSLFGTLYTDIDVETAPALTAGEAAGLLVQGTGAASVDRPLPDAVILPLLGGLYELAYPLTLEDAHTYFVSAADGAVVQKEAAFDTQSAVGAGAGFLGDTKKISTTQEGGRYEARDRLRPSEVITLDAGFDVERLVRLLQPGPPRVPRWTSSDIAVDTDNDWDDAAVVDGHVHMGWTYDYFAQRHGWEGLDGVNGRIVGIVNNGFFQRHRLSASVRSGWRRRLRLRSNRGARLGGDAAAGRAAHRGARADARAHVLLRRCADGWGAGRPPEQRRPPRPAELRVGRSNVQLSRDQLSHRGGT